MDKIFAEGAAPKQHGLITQERAEKFDLLRQVILNQREAIILCGAEGIGKTTLLHAFKEERQPVWIVCLLQGLETLSINEIQTQLVATVQQYYPEAGDDLPILLSLCEQQQKKVVLAIDDAGKLAAGLITALTEYALHNPVLRMVFALTREQLYLKNITDKAVDDCYFMEIPNLTKADTLLFLQDSPLFSNAEGNAQQISDKLLTKLYQRTDGIPGKILAELPLLIKLQQQQFFSPLKVLLFVVIIIGSGLFYASAKRDNFFLNLAWRQPNSVKPATKPAVIDMAKHNEVVKIAEVPKTQPTLSQAAEIKANKPVLEQDADEQWILQQAPEKYALQLIALSKRQSLLNIVKKHHDLQTELKILQINSQNQEKYILLYGSFADARSALTAARSLPTEFKQAWPRQFKMLQQEVKKRVLPSLK